MGQLRGYKSTVEFIAESTYGALPASGTMLLFGHATKVTTKSEIDVEGKARLKASGSTTTREVAEVQTRLEHHSVSVEFSPLDETTADSWTDAWAIVCGSTAGLADDLTSVSVLHMAESGSLEMCALGCIGDTLEMSCNKGEDIVCTIQMVAQDIKVATDLSGSAALTLSITRASEFDTTYTILNFADTGITISGTSMDNCTGWSLKIENGVEERYRLGNNPELAAEVIPKMRTISGKFVFDLQDATEYKELLGRAKHAATIKVGGKTITLTDVVFESIEVPSSPDDLIATEIPWTARTLALA